MCKGKEGGGGRQMSQADIFAALQGGAHFDRTRFRRDIDRFGGAKAARPPPAASATEPPPAAPGAGKRSAKRAKRAKAKAAEVRSTTLRCRYCVAASAGRWCGVAGCCIRIPDTYTYKLASM